MYPIKAGIVENINSPSLEFPRLFSIALQCHLAAVKAALSDDCSVGLRLEELEKVFYPGQNFFRLNSWII